MSDSQKTTDSPVLTPETRVSLPIVGIAIFLVSFTGWSWFLFSALDDMQDGLGDVVKEVSELRTDVARISNNNVTIHEVRNWLEQFGKANEGLDIPKFPHFPR